MTKDLVKRPTRIEVEDSLSKISDIITGKLAQWDCFDVELPVIRLEAVKRVIKARDLEWADPDLAYDDIIVIVVGVKGADFKDHEERR